jgi:hypothetical protein
MGSPFFCLQLQGEGGGFGRVTGDTDHGQILSERIPSVKNHATATMVKVFRDMPLPI